MRDFPTLNFPPPKSFFTKKPHVIGYQRINLNQSLNNCIIPYLLLLHLHSRGNADLQKKQKTQVKIHMVHTPPKILQVCQPIQNQKQRWCWGAWCCLFSTLDIAPLGKCKSASINTWRQKVVSSLSTPNIQWWDLLKATDISTVSSGSGEAAHTLIAKQPDHSLVHTALTKVKRNRWVESLKQSKYYTILYNTERKMYINWSSWESSLPIRQIRCT